MQLDYQHAYFRDWIGWNAHLVSFIIKNPHILRVTLIMIITDAFLFHTPTIVFQFGIATPSTRNQYPAYRCHGAHPNHGILASGNNTYIYGTLQTIDRKSVV